uniref:Poly(A) polymerase RNA-binding domain-containing protein n=1 Tax=Meloidogyne enterolobii TaxID=390850 RepID=A0A6V7VDX3_MELEN|nr:unnamed protein product [Meloidogyne enterolobii]
MNCRKSGIYFWAGNPDSNFYSNFNFFIGLKGLRQIRNSNEASHSTETLKQWIKGVDFVDKYNHFVTIICVGIDKNIGEDFCNFVKNRIRVELVLSLEEYPKLEYSHISPNKSKKGKCEKRLIAGKKFKNFGKTIGVNNGLLV